MHIWNKFRSLRIVVILILTYTIIGFLIIPLAIQYSLPMLLKKELNVNSNIRSLYFNPYTFEVRLSKFNILDNSKKPLVGFETFYFNFEPNKLFSKSILIDSIYINKFYTSVILDEKKVPNYQFILDFISKKTTPKPKTNDNSTGVENITLTINSFKFENSSIYFEDNSLSEPYVIKSNHFDINVNNISTKENTKADVTLSLDLDNTLNIHSKNTITLIPLKVDGNLVIKDFQINKVFTYIQDGFDFNLESGRISNSLNFHLIKDENSTKITINNNKLIVDSLNVLTKEIKTGFQKLSNHTKKIDIIINDKLSVLVDNSDLKIENIKYSDKLNTLDISSADILMKKFNLDGNISMQSTLERIALDKVKLKNRELPFISLNKLSIDNIDADISKNSYIIDQVSLASLGVDIDLYKNSTTTFDYISSTNKETNTTKETEKKATEDNSTSPYFLVKDIKLQKSYLTFNDKQRVKTEIIKLKDIEAEVVSLSSDDTQTTTIKLKSDFNKYGNILINGELIAIKPLQKSKINIAIENIDLSAFSQYSGQFIAREVDKGKLGLDLEYNINNYILNSTNRLKVKDLQLGEHVDSKDAINAPVGLAIALIKSPSGLIDLSIPVNGDIKSPDFSFGGAILKSLTNVLLNVVSAPFKLLGSLLNIGGDELSNVKFKYASSTLDAPQKETLTKLSQALHKRVDLKLTFSPAYDKINDTLALQNQKVDQNILLLLKENNKSSKSKIIEKIYATNCHSEDDNKTLALFMEKLDKKDKNYEINLTQFMKDRVVKKTIIAEEELITLAKKRADRIKAFLVLQKLDPKRIEIKSELIEQKTNDGNNVILEFELGV